VEEEAFDVALEVSDDFVESDFEASEPFPDGPDDDESPDDPFESDDVDEWSDDVAETVDFFLLPESFT
jgi:hypothetical protein